MIVLCRKKLLFISIHTLSLVAENVKKGIIQLVTECKLLQKTDMEFSVSKGVETMTHGKFSAAAVDL